jgi:hypothetical protein
MEKPKTKRDSTESEMKLPEGNMQLKTEIGFNNKQLLTAR